MSRPITLQPAGLLAIVDELVHLRQDNTALRAGRGAWPSRPPAGGLLDPHL